jgi:hypothetical protein
MNISKIAGGIAIGLAVVAAFLNVPYVALILALIGVVIGWGSTEDAHVRVIVSALALRAFAPAFNELPGAGSYLTAILNNFAIAMSGMAIMIILRNIYRRLTS